VFCSGRNVASFGAAPAGYVAGRGRGISGFGAPSESAPLPGQAPVTGLAAPPKAAGENEDESAFSDTKWDEFNGFTENLFGAAPYEDDDREADLIYEAIDRRMDSRRKSRRFVAPLFLH
jgi:pre-mRNA-processing factor 6